MTQSKSFWIRSVLIFGAILWGTLCVAQAESKLTGTVLSIEGKPLPGASVTLYNSQNQIRAYAITNQEGEFEISSVLSAGTYNLKASFIGFETHTKSVSLPQDSTVIRIQFRLKMATSILDSIYITNEAAVKIRKDTIEYVADSFRTLESRKIGDLLKNIDGFSVREGGQISYRGKEVKALLMDGDNLLGKDYGMITTNLSAEIVDKIQVFENYHKNRLMGNVSKNTDVAVNLKLKSGFKGKLSGNASLAHSFTDKFEVEAGLFYFNKNLKFLQFINTNNIGKSNGSKIFAINYEDFRNSPTENLFLNESKSYPLINTNTLSKPPLEDSYTSFNTDFFVLPVLHSKMSEKLKMTFQLGYLSQSEKIRENAFIQTFISEDEFWNTKTESDYNFVNRSFLGSIRFDYDNQKAVVGDLKFQFSAPWRRTQFNQTTSLSFVDVANEDFELDRTNLGVDYAAAWQTGSNTILSFTGAFFNKNEIGNLELLTKKFQDYFKNSAHFFQSTKGNVQIGKSYLQFMSRFNKTTLKYGIEGASEFSNTKRGLADYGYQVNASSRKNKSIKAGLLFSALKETADKFEYGIKINQGVSELKIANNNLNRTVISYKYIGIASYKIKPFASLTVDIASARELPSLNYFYFDTAITGGVIYLAADEIVPISLKEVNLSFSQHNFRKNSSFLSKVWLIKYEKNYQQDAFYNERMTELKYSPVIGDKEIGIMVNGKSFVYFIRSTISGSLYYQKNVGHSYVNNERVVNRSNHFNGSLKYVSAFKLPLKFECDVNTTYLGISQIVRQEKHFDHYLFSYSVRGVIKWYLNEKMYVATEYRLWADNQDHSFQSMGMFGTILWNRRFSSDLKIHNLLNQETYERRIIAPNVTGQDLFDVIPRYVLLSLNYNF